ncbi:MAG: VPS10 domain-containing protein [Vulcanimicrobiaceae bacterium]
MSLRTFAVGISASAVLFCVLPALAQTNAASPSPAPSASPTSSPTPGPAYGKLKWRAVGPAASGGRIAAVAGSATNTNLYYAGTAGGGVWKTTNGGQTWQAVFADQKVSAIGALAIDPTDDNTVYAGTGETNPRNDVSYGDGLYKTTDGGKTWTKVGLENTRHISRIIVDPHDRNHVIAGALGDVFGDSVDRGVYVSDDAGKTWSKTLYVGPQSGASDIAIDVQHPNVVYAGIWQFRREPWTFHSGGDQDGLYKSTDGGKTWTRLTGHGLPDGITGRIGLAVAPSNGNRVYALIEASGGILWRSDDGGANWTMTSNDTIADQRPFYFSHVEVDPKDPDRVYGISNLLALSTDGGKKFHGIADQVHGDYHAMWIAPNDPNRMIVGEDGGQAISLDRGKTWFDMLNMNIGQFYHVGVSSENPYTICGGLQDNLAWCGASNSLDPGGIANKDWFITAYGDGMWAVPDPVDPDYIWSDWQNGGLVLYNRKSRDSWNVQPYFPSMAEQFDSSQSKYRFNWDSPIAFDPFDGHVAWFGGNVVFQTTDRGFHWKAISPDLTRNTKAHQVPSGGPITKDVSGAEYSDNILYIEASPLRKGEIWVGTDDGLVQMTLDGGRHWKNVTPPAIDRPDTSFGRVETAAPSPVKDGTAYVNVDRHRSGDFKPYLFVTHDFGKHWTSITNGLPADQYVRTVRPDIHNAGLVYAGTENGLWISFDGGSSWENFKNELPTVSVRDIRMQPQFDDLLIATHGRSIYVMDDVRSIQQLKTAQARGEMLFAPRVAYEYNLHGNDEGAYTNFVAGNPPNGVIVDFYQKQKQTTPPKIDILDGHGHVLRSISGTHKVEGKEVPYVPNEPGINRYVWDFQQNGPVKWEGAAQEYFKGPNEGFAVPPGTYQVRLTLGNHSYTQPVTVKNDPHSVVTDAQVNETIAFANRSNHQLSVVDTMLNNLDAAKKQLDAASADAKKKNDVALQSQIDAATAARKTVFDELTANYQNGEDFIQHPGKLREDIFAVVQGISAPVTPALRELNARVDDEYHAGVRSYNAYVASLQPLNDSLRKAGLKPLTGVSPVSL